MSCGYSPEPVEIYNNLRPEAITCSQNCSGTLLCGNNASLRVEEYLNNLPQASGYELVTCQDAAKAAGQVVFTKNEALSCTAACAGSNHCGTSTDSIEQYLVRTERDLVSKQVSSCRSVTSNNAPYPVSKQNVTVQTVCSANETFTPAAES